MFFSILLVVKNEEKYIGSLLDALIQQDFPKQEYEIIIVDGNSTDQTLKIVKQYQSAYPEMISVYHNEKETLPSGWNIGIRHSKGKYVIRLDGHSHIPADFLMRNYEVITKVPEAACVGGVIETRGHGFWGRVNSYVYSHPMGVGNSKFRIAKGNWEGYVDTVPYGAYKRQIFEQVGYFNEHLRRNEDLEMNARIRQIGGTFFLSTRIRSIYFVRDSWYGLMQKSLHDGKWTMIASRQGAGVLRLRHLIPLFVFIMGMLMFIGSFFSRTVLYVFSFLIVLYLLLITASSVSVISRFGLGSFIPTIFTFTTLHISRGAASFFSFFSKHYWRKGM